MALKTCKGFILIRVVVFAVFLFVLYSGQTQAQERGSRGSASSPITLTTSEGTFNVNPIQGHFYKIAVPFRGFQYFIRYPFDAFSLRIKDRAPAFILYSNDAPHDFCWIVEIKNWKDDNSLVLDLHSPSGYERTVASNEPAEEVNIVYDAIEEKPGQWKLTPKKALKPGIYGLFRWAKNNTTKSYLYGFTVADGPVSNTSVDANASAPTMENSRLYSNIKGIYLKNGQYIEGQVLNIENEILKIRTIDNKILSYHFIRDIKKFAYK